MLNPARLQYRPYTEPKGNKIKFIGKSLLALMIFAVILKLGMIVMVFVAIAITAKVMSGQY